MYTLNKQLTDVEILTYTVKVDAGNGVDVKTATAEVRIIPATSMYYEENFDSLVTYTDGKSTGWTVEGTAQTDYQESDLVGSTTDSPYGTDAAYKNNSGDSYGTSRKVDTTSGAAQFSYEFTGTGTTVFARMTASTGYLQIKLYQGESLLSTTYRDTKILGESISTLYNVPVYDNQEPRQIPTREQEMSSTWMVSGSMSRWIQDQRSTTQRQMHIFPMLNPM